MSLHYHKPHQKASIEYEKETSPDFSYFICTSANYKSLLTSTASYNEYIMQGISCNENVNSFIDALYVLRNNTEYPVADLSAEYTSSAINENYKNEVLEAVEIAIKYKGYIDRERKLAEKIMRLENLSIPDDFDFDKVQSLSIECRQKLKKYSPRTIAQASRISGVSPADISVLLVYFGR